MCYIRMYVRTYVDPLPLLVHTPQKGRECLSKLLIDLSMPANRILACVYTCCV